MISMCGQAELSGEKIISFEGKNHFQNLELVPAYRVLSSYRVLSYLPIVSYRAIQETKLWWAAGR